MAPIIYTVGHSNHTIDHFLSLLRRHGISAVGDVRSVPYSRCAPHFNRRDLSVALRNAGITHVFLGRELGGKTNDPECLLNYQVQYDRVARSSSFQKGIERIRTGIGKYTIALMCAEGEPNSCHRSVLISKSLVETGFDVRHILPCGDAETHCQSMQRLISFLGLDIGPFLSEDEDLSERAYKIQSKKIAYSNKPNRLRSRQPDRESRDNEDIYDRVHEDDGKRLF